MTEKDAAWELCKISCGLVDVRADRGKRHKLPEILFLAVVGIIAGAKDCSELWRFGTRNLLWFRQFLELKHGVPSHDTFLNVLGLIKPEAFEELVRAWTRAMHAPEAIELGGKHVAIDGQSLRGSANRAVGASAVHMISAYLTASGVTVGTARVDEKGNEITEIPNLIASLNLRGATVTIDAMGCQRGIASQIREAGANYVLQVKENQPTLAADLRAATAEVTRRRRPGEAAAVVERHREVDKGHGRIETRVCILSHDISLIQKAADWRDLAGIVVMLRERQDVISGKTSHETSWYILSDQAATAAEISKIIRDHWAIENGLHWSLDVTWGSDRHQVRNREAAENLPRLRRFGLGLVKSAVGWGETARGVQQFCQMDPDYTLRVLAGQTIGRKRTRVPNRPKTGPRALKPK